MSEQAPARRLDAIDFARIPTIALVVAVHAVSPLPLTAALGAFVIVFHASREIFFLLTAFVLTYGYGRGAVGWPSFWRRRYLYVGVPYLVWSLVYFVALGNPLDPVSDAAATLGGQLLHGTAQYHLYFLLVSLQMYAAFPLIRLLLRATSRHHGLLLAAAAAFQVAFSAAVHERWAGASLLSTWLQGPDAVLPSYTLYVLAGGVAAWHVEDLLRWTRDHAALVLVAAAACVAAAVGVYAAQVGWMQRTPELASEVFQPVVVVESVAVAWGFLAAGLLWVSRGTPRRRLVLAGSDASFGIYLGHPLLVQILTGVAGATGLLALATGAPDAVVIPALLLAVVPAVYLVTGAMSVVARRTPASLALTGRSQRRTPQSDAHPAPQPGATGTRGTFAAAATPLSESA